MRRKRAYDTSVAVERRRDFILACSRAEDELKAMGVLGWVSPKCVVDKALSYPSPRFYVTEYEVLRVFRRLRRNLGYGIKRRETLEQYEELLERFKKAKVENPNTEDIDVISSIVTQQAPKFYIGARSAYILYLESKKK